jgi:hypothetical protein
MAPKIVCYFIYDIIAIWCVYDYILLRVYMCWTSKGAEGNISAIFTIYTFSTMG